MIVKEYIKSFEKLGIPSIDADAVYKELTVPYSPLLFELKSFFGEEVVSSDGSLNRKALSSIVFAPGAEEKLTALNKITHAAITKEVEFRIEALKKAGHSAVIYDAPLLFESGFNEKCDFIIATIASTDVKIKRIMQRDSIDAEAASRRLRSQISDEELRKRADFVIENSKDTSFLDDCAKSILEKILL